MSLHKCDDLNERFFRYLDSLAELYGVEHNHVYGLEMGHGHYTGGSTLAPRDRGCLETNLKPIIEGYLEYCVDACRVNIRQSRLTVERWEGIMGSSVGKVARYEWEYILNELGEVDQSLRAYLDILKGFESDIVEDSVEPPVRLVGRLLRLFVGG